MSAGFVGEAFSVDAVGLGFAFTFSAVDPVSSSPNHAETVGCKSQMSAKEATMIRASLACESSVVLRRIVKFFQKAKKHLP